MTSRLSLWQTKLKAAKAEQHQHEKMLRQQYRALERIQKQITELENKIEHELAKAQQRTGAYDRGTSVEFA
jgi:predicted  nucleic acid-binding Zn-ribbon protein